MANFSNDLLLESFRIPWLLWIQFLILFLLTLSILVSYFGLFALDSPNNDSDALISSPPSRFELHLGCIQRTQVSEDRDFHEDTPTSPANREREVQDNSERDISSAKDLFRASGSERLINPCHYFDLARQAFLKCLGLGSSSSRKSRGAESQHED